MTSLDATMHQGIDGVYYKKGSPEEYIIAEAKYTTTDMPRLNMTRNGRQMSNKWIQSRNRLRNAVGQEVMDKILMQGYESQLVKIDPSGNVTINHIRK